MGGRFHVVSADDHVQEPPDLWTSRVSKRYGDHVPRVVAQADGSERWVFDNKVRLDRRLAATGALSSERHKEPQRWSDVPREAFDPSARLKAMDRDSVDVEVLYPSAAGVGGEYLAALADPNLVVAAAQAYNDWLLDTWQGDRFVPQCILPVSSVQAAKQELERAVGAGHRGAVMPAFPFRIRPDLPHISDPAWDPLWDAAQHLGVPICWHSGADHDFLLEVYPEYSSPVAQAYESVRSPVSAAIGLGAFLLGGVPERFPNLKVVFGGSALDWVVFQIENCDHEWNTSMLAKEGVPKPSELFRRQCYVTTWFERAGFNQLGDIGVDNILWQSEFPMGTSTYPRSAEFIKRNLAGLTEVERRKITHANATQLYRLD